MSWKCYGNYSACRNELPRETFIFYHLIRPSSILPSHQRLRLMPRLNVLLRAALIKAVGSTEVGPNIETYLCSVFGSRQLTNDLCWRLFVKMSKYLVHCGKYEPLEWKQHWSCALSLYFSLTWFEPTTPRKRACVFKQMASCAWCLIESLSEINSVFFTWKIEPLFRLI